MMGNKIPAFWRAVLVIIVSYLIFDNAFPPLLPQALLVQYMIITILSVLLYYSYDEARWTEFKSPILSVLRDDDKGILRKAFLIIIPLIVGYTTYGMVKPSVDTPVELRQVHPAPPSSLRVYDKKYDLSSLENPLRLEVLETLKNDRAAGKELYNSYIEEGREVYYKNCFYCHGDLLDGEGHFAHGFSPLPINFQDVGTIAQLQEAFLFWRITTGGPGLPKEGTPWNSAMPVWHEILEEDEVWKVITFLYDYVGQVPRMWDQEISRTVSGLKDEINAERATQMGKELYMQRCTVCHGDEGMGDGAAADHLYPRPRDFSLGLFKYKTTPGTVLPKDDDLFKTIKFGLFPGTGMPGWAKLLSDEQIRSLIPIIKGFDTSAAWAPEEAEDEDFDDDGLYLKTDYLSFTEDEPLTGRIAFSEESAAKGKPRFEKVCGKCHGKEGRGNITSGKRLEDDWGFRLWPRDLTKPWTWRWSNVAGDDDASRDATVNEIYQRLSTGLPGTPMPAHRATEEGNKDPVSEEDRWHISNYVYTLRNKTVAPSDKPIVEAMKVEGALPNDINDEAWASAPAVTLHMVPNVIKEERLFTPLNDAVTVRVLYNQDDIAFLMEVNDRTNSRPGEQTSEEIHDGELEFHSDALAVQFPKDESFEVTPVVVKPLYRHGDGSHPTTMWYWNAGSVEPAMEQRNALIDATGPDAKLSFREGDDSLATTASWEHGQWKVLMTRPREGGDSGDLNFVEGQFIPVSFANWDGNNGEIGSRHTLTSWYWLLLPEEADLAKVYGIPAGMMILFLLLGIVVVRSQRGKL